MNRIAKWVKGVLMVLGGIVAFSLVMGLVFGTVETTTETTASTTTLREPSPEGRNLEKKPPHNNNNNDNASRSG